MASIVDSETPTLIFGHGEFFSHLSKVIPSFSEMVAPLTNLLKASGSGTGMVCGL